MAIEAEGIAARALREYLLRVLPARVTTINALRAATLRAPRAGPYTIPALGKLRLGQAPGGTLVALTAGVRTTTQVAAEISAAAIAGVTASADSLDRLLITNGSAPTAGSPSAIFLDADETVTADCHTAFGFDPGGDRVVRNALVAPSSKGIADGWPLYPDLGPGFWVILEDRVTEPRGNVHDNMHKVTVDLAIMRAEPTLAVHRSREHIQACVRAVREAIISDRSLDQAVHSTFELSCRVAGKPFSFEDAGPGTPLMDIAVLSLLILVYERVG